MVGFSGEDIESLDHKCQPSHTYQISYCPYGSIKKDRTWDKQVRYRWKYEFQGSNFSVSIGKIEAMP